MKAVPAVTTSCTAMSMYVRVLGAHQTAIRVAK